MNRHRKQAGFTLIELLLVLVILGTLAAIVVPQLAGEGKEAKITRANVEIKMLGQALDRYEMHNDAFPGTDEGLQSLISAPSEAKTWKGPYLKTDKLPTDPWGNEYQYKQPGDHNKKGYDLWSYGPDKREGGDDDIANWTTDAQKK